MDWDAWARDVEQRLDVAAGGNWRGLFAPGATFTDPVVDRTADVRQVARDTRAVFPDWTEEITWIRGGDDWAFFEWTGRATYTPAGGGPGAGTRVEMHGGTVVELDDQGRVVRWRDYLDRKEIEDQIRRAVKQAKPG